MKVNLSPRAKEARRKYMADYMRDWRKKKSDKAKQIQERFWENLAKEDVTHKANDQ